MLILDIETIPQAAEVLREKMPEELRNPQMPPDLENPAEPDWQEKCPAYSLPELIKKREAADEAVRNNEDEEKGAKLRGAAIAASAREDEARAKRNRWIEENAAKWKAQQEAAVEKWRLGIFEEKQRFIQNAALDARLGHAKLIGLRDTEKSLDRVFIWEPDLERVRVIRKWAASLESVMVDGNRRTMFRGRQIELLEYREEATMLRSFYRTLRTWEDNEPEGELATYYGKQFDLPFLYRRSWILGHPQRANLMEGRFWDRRVLDLHDAWQMGCRDERSGGLEGLARSLGYTGAKSRDGATFWEWYQRDPSEGVCYLLNDLDMTEFSALRMGVLES